MTLAHVRSAATALGVVPSLLVGCTPSPTATAPAPTVGSGAAPGVDSRIDPRWMGIDDPKGGWKMVDRSIFHDRQTVELRPSDETFEYPGQRSNCNNSNATVTLTVYARGAFDPAAVRTGRPVTVNGGVGYFLAPRWPIGAVLAWQYGTNAWATAQGRSKTTGDVGRLTQLVGMVRTERTPVTFPLGLSDLPADMPLTAVDYWDGRTTLSFGGCGYVRIEVPEASCDQRPDLLAIQMYASDDFPSFREDADGRHEVYTIPVDIGGRPGYLHEERDTEAAIRVAPGVVVGFTLSGPRGRSPFGSAPPATRLRDVLADVTWAPNTADGATWPAVGDWAK